MGKAGRIFFFLLAALYPLAIFGGLYLLKLPPRFVALLVGFIALGYFLAAQAKKKSLSPGFFGFWGVPPCSSAWGPSVL
jgi:hypothetical protein